MKKNYFCITIFVGLIIIGLSANAQKKFTISGTVTSKAKGETIIGATVKVADMYTISNDYGFYSITVDKGVYTIETSSAGLQTMAQELTVPKLLKL